MCALGNNPLNTMNNPQGNMGTQKKNEVSRTQSKVKEGFNLNDEDFKIHTNFLLGLREGYSFIIFMKLIW